MIKSSQQTADLGFIGIGRMGLPMSGRLIAAGHNVYVFDLDSDKMIAAEKAGAKAAKHPAEVADRAKIVFLCLTDGAAVEEVVFGSNGVAAVRGLQKVVVDLSSIHPDNTRSMAARLKVANGMAWIDAPVSGRPAGRGGGHLSRHGGRSGIRN
jgi:3-hydroxyisobutyrate dehydrogenase